MSSESLHAPRERLSRATITHHQAIVSLIEELEAVDWYRQRADDCEDVALKEILLHNMREEMEHASMVLEWLRRSDPNWGEMMKTYLFTEVPILEVEETETSGDAATSSSDASDAKPVNKFTIGTLKDGGN
ncbi:MAG: ferritin [Rhodospirillales bacterium]|nr:ferritin [Rhodospirillales bacterium]